MNICVISGNLTRDPELSYSGDLAICRNGVAVNESVKDKDNPGEWVERAHFFNVTYFGRRGELMAEKAVKGDKVTVQGRLSYSTWENDAGEKRSSVEIIANDVEGDFRYRKSGEAPKSTPTTNEAASGTPADDSDIPF